MSGDVGHITSWLRAALCALASICSAILVAEQIAVHETKSLGGPAKSVNPITNEFRVQPQRVVVGQELVFQCVLTYDPRRINVRGLQVPQYQDTIFHTPFEGPLREQVEVDGVQMVRLTWGARAYPRQVGVLSLPGIDVEYGAIQERRGSSFFSWAFSREEHLHLIKSHDATITVEPLPVASRQIDAVGQYQSCSLRVDRSSIAQGEAVAMFVMLTGSGNAGFEANFSPVVPQGCTWYRDGAVRTQTGAQFAFVLQCNEAGTVTLPPQQFLCYDPLSKKLNTIVSNQLTLTVSPSAASSASLKVAQDTELEDELVAEDASIVQRSKPSFVRRVAIPLPVFLIICLLLIGGMICWAWWLHVMRMVRRFQFFMERIGSFISLYLRVKGGRLRARDAYNFFIRYVTAEHAERMGVEWQAFWLELQGYYFGGSSDSILSQGECERVLFWARRLWGRRGRRGAVYTGLIIIGVSCVASEPPCLGQQIKILRESQRYTSLSGYDEHEQEIAQLCGAESTCRRYSGAVAHVCRWSHLLPVLFWQLFFLAGLALVFRRRARILGVVVLVVAGLALLGISYERSDRWRYVITEAPLYLGPGSEYPIRRGVASGDEVRLIHAAPGKGGTWLLVDACGEKGWLAHDVVV